MDVFFGDGKRIIGTTVDVVTPFGIIVLSLVLFGPFGPTSGMEDFRSFIVVECLRRKISEFPDGV